MAQAPAIDLLDGEGMPHHAPGGRALVYHRIYFGVDCPAARAVGIAVPARAGLLAKTARFAQPIDNPG
jgi:hypothetical protein